MTRIMLIIDNFSDTLNIDPGNMEKKAFTTAKKSVLKFSRIAKFGGELL